MGKDTHPPIQLIAQHPHVWLRVLKKWAYKLCVYTRALNKACGVLLFTSFFKIKNKQTSEASGGATLERTTEKEQWVGEITYEQN